MTSSEILLDTHKRKVTRGIVPVTMAILQHHRLDANSIFCYNSKSRQKNCTIFLGLIIIIITGTRARIILHLTTNPAFWTFSRYAVYTIKTTKLTTQCLNWVLQ